MPEVVTLGETMVMFSPDQNGALRYVHSFRKRFAGAESNVAIGLVRLGHSCGWISKVGDDEFGRFVLREVRAEGVEVSQVKFHESAPTGIMFKEISEGRDTRVYYYRKDSAASRMVPGDLDAAYIAGARVLHVTGITPALSATCMETLMQALVLARSHGGTVSFDPNIRLKLWSREEATLVIKNILPYVDIALPGMEEGEILFHKKDPDEVIDAFLESGAKTVALKLGAEGCIVADASRRCRMDAYKVEKAVDPIGAGDAFAAGFLAAYLEGGSLEECGKMANAMGAYAVTTAGDIEGLPQRNELEAFMRKEAITAR